MSIVGFLNFGTTDTLGQIILVVGAYLVHGRMVSSITDLFPPDNSSSSQSQQSQMSLDIAKYSLGAKQSLAETS